MTETHVFDKDIVLESGDLLAQVQITYTTYGTLNEARDNVIWVCHALTASSDLSEWWSELFGKDNFFNPDNYFIICANNLGSPYGTTSARSIHPISGERYGLDFPFFTIRDTSNLHLLLMKNLGISQIHILIGGSCGGNIAQEVAIELGSELQHLFLLCCSARETPWVIGIHESQRIALHADPTFNDNQENAGTEGLRGARAFALPFYRTYESFEIRQSEEDNEKIKSFKAASYIRYQGQKFVERYDAHCYYTQLKSLDTHNIGRGRESIKQALQMISAHTLCIGFSSDLLIPIKEQKFLAEYIPNASYIEIDTDFGHDAFLIETERLRVVMMEFVGDK